jgi:hypothetical protein
MAGTLRVERRRIAQIVLPAYARVPSCGVVDGSAPTSIWGVALLVLALPMFAQCFQYMVDVLPLYFLSKAWPFMMLPLFMWGLMRLDLPGSVLQIVTLLWILGVTPVIGIIQLGNDIAAALVTSVKVWPFTFAFSLAALLVLLRTPDIVLRRTVLSLGVATYVIMLLLWLIVPSSAYGGGDAITKLFMYDPERGCHIYMPMFFGTLLIFYLNRSFWMRPRIWVAILAVVAFVLQLTIDKERAAIAGVAVTTLLAAVMSAQRWRLAAWTGLALVAGIGMIYAVGRLQGEPDLQTSLGGSLAVRHTSVVTAWNYISADALRWLFGIGATTRFGDITLAQLFGNRMFFLSDIGWLGVAFEYGIIGAMLMALVHLRGLLAAARLSTRDDPLSQALADYIVYLIVVSVVYSVVFTPGELTTVMGLSYYLAREKRRALAAYRGQSSQLPNAMPRHIALASPKPSGNLSPICPSGFASKG